MVDVNRDRHLFAPPFCKGVETYILPIPKSKYELHNGLKIAGGWRYFNDLRVIQKKNDSYVEVLMSTSEFISSAKMASKKSLRKAELHIENIVRKRLPFATIDMSLPHVMGVLNLTPDSFYKKSRENNTKIVLRKCKRMVQDGATVIDIGGESSRPGADKISEKTEQERVEKILNQLKHEDIKSIISLDTRNLGTMKLGYNIGVDIINDISGLDTNDKVEFVASKNLPVIVMHMQNKPENMQINPQYNFSPIDVYNFFSKKINDLLHLGLDISNLAIDPGIGFGKNKYHNLDILKNLSIFHGLGVPILIGISRKSLIGELAIEDFKSRGIYKRSVGPSSRLSGSLAFSIHAFNNGIQLIRTHDVFETRQALTCQFSLN